MSCPDCSTATGFPNTCGQVVVVNYRPPEASSAIPAWLEYNCDGEEPELILYSTPELDETIDDWDIDYIELIGRGISGTSCADPVHADLCPPTLEAIHDMFVEQTTAINANIDAEIQAQTASINANIDEAETAIVNAIGAAADDVEAAISGQTSALESALEDVESAIATASANQISAVETAADDIEAAIGSATNIIVESLTIVDPNYTYAYTYTANGDLETITRTTTAPGFPPCEVQTYSYDGSFNLTGTSAWVACP